MKTRIWGSVASLIFAPVAVQAQGGIGLGAGRGGAVGPMIEQFQQAGTISAVPAGRGLSMLTSNTNQTVTGRPVSGTEVRKSLQTLGDGTEISTSASNLFYRDSAGRTRIEMTSQGRTVIADPVAGYTITLFSETKTARRLATPAVSAAKIMANSMEYKETGSSTYTVTVSDGASTSTVTTGGPVALGRAGRGGPRAAENRKHEELGVESLNGLLAAGTRDTLTIPQGQIGNNRDIHVVNERWYSDDLQMLVKTVNSDPRFGENTYEFTNVSRDEPDASLFQIPADYEIVDLGSGRAVKVLPAPVTNK
jgi:hypothetical protein